MNDLKPSYENLIDNDLLDLYEILSLRRAKNSTGELRMIMKFILPTGANRDAYGNWWLKIGDDPKVMWSCHTDTVHHPYDDKDDYRQKLNIDQVGCIGSNGECLGADNGVGVWLLLRMIAAGKEGLYIFHREEETGAGGSKHISNKTPELVQGIKYAIAFDRRQDCSVITHQGTRCCSDAFADSLIAALGIETLQKDDGGTFTDTAMYTHLIPECTNVSAGFNREHSNHEYLDQIYAKKLLAAVLQLDVTKLVEKRKTDDPVEYPDYTKYYRQWNGDSSWSQYLSDKYEDYYMSPVHGTDKKAFIEEHADVVYQVLKDWKLLDDVIDDVRRYLF